MKDLSYPLSKGPTFVIFLPEVTNSKIDFIGINRIYNRICRFVGNCKRVPTKPQVRYRPRHIIKTLKHHFWPHRNFNRDMDGIKRDVGGRRRRLDHSEWSLGLVSFQNFLKPPRCRTQSVKEIGENRQSKTHKNHFLSLEQSHLITHSE